MGQQLSDKIVGPVFFGDPGQIGEDAARLYARHTIIDQLTFDPNIGFTGQLPTDGPVILAWADRELLPVEIEGATPRRTGNVLWFLPTELAVSGTTTFRNDLLRSTVISSDAAFFSKDPFTINFGRGSGRAVLPADRLRRDAHGDRAGHRPQLRRPGLHASTPSPSSRCPRSPNRASEGRSRTARGRTSTGCRRSSCSISRRRPGSGCHTSTAAPGTPSPSPARYVDPATGTVLIRLVNDNSDGVGFSLDLSITGDVK